MESFDEMQIYVEVQTEIFPYISASPDSKVSLLFDYDGMINW